MSPMPIASVTLAPHAASSLARIAGSPPPGSPATSTRLTLELGEIHAALARPFGEMQRVGRGHRDDGRLQKIDRRHQPLGVAGADGDVAEPEPVEGAERRAGDEGTGVVGRDEALAARDSRRRVGARRSAHPDLEIASGERNVARRPGRAAGRIDARDLFGPRGQMRADRLVRRCASARSSSFSVSGSAAIASRPPTAPCVAKPARSSLPR